MIRERGFPRAFPITSASYVPGTSCKLVSRVNLYLPLDPSIPVSRDQINGVEAVFATEV